MNQPNAAAKKALNQYTKIVKDYDEFIEANKAIIVEYEAKTEKKRLETFRLHEQIDMKVEAGEIPTDIFLDNETVELGIRSDGRVALFEKKNYGTAHLQNAEK